jgi:hypothetical protein
MKTTLDLNDQLLANAKALAAQQRTSLTRQSLSPPQRRPTRKSLIGQHRLVASVGFRVPDWPSAVSGASWRNARE